MLEAGGMNFTESISVIRSIFYNSSCFNFHLYQFLFFLSVQVCPLFYHYPFNISTPSVSSFIYVFTFFSIAYSQNVPMTGWGVSDLIDWGCATGSSGLIPRFRGIFSPKKVPMFGDFSEKTVLIFTICFSKFSGVSIVKI